MRKGTEKTMRQQLVELRRAMEKHGIDLYMIPTDDFHASEYVGAHFRGRHYVSGFTGSAGTLLVSKDWAGLWTDGRYFLQAGAQLSGSGIELCKMGEPGVPTLAEYIAANMKAGQHFGFDGRVVTAAQYSRLQSIAQEKGFAIVSDVDLLDEIWAERPPMSAEPAWELPVTLTGRSRVEKLTQVRREMEAAGADTLILSSLMDICWLMNLRGNDVACTPVLLSFCAVTQQDAVLFVNPSILSADIQAHLKADGVSIRPYACIYEYVKKLPEDSAVMMNLNVVNSLIRACVPATVRVINHVDPTEKPKAAKNPTEVEGFRKAHVQDGVAVTRLMYWLKHNAGKIPMDELSVAAKLEEFRRERPDYIGPSFDPIVAYGYHGAIVHYSPTEETNIPVEPRSLLLADTGGHYLQGTTDITRTFAMGETTDEEKKLFTLVLKGHLHLGNARWKYGCTGSNLDYLAREPLWQENLDYNHGTGHGVGYVLSVHEGPQRIHWRANPVVLEPGMVTSDEPGFYLEGKFGIRHENLTVVCEGETNSYGRFLHFEYLTMVPFDLDAVDPAYLNEDDKALLNAYHAQVREKILPYLSGDEAEWLIHATRAI